MKRWFGRAASLAAAAWMAAAACAWAQNGDDAHTVLRLPALGDAVSNEWDILDERRLGERIMRGLRRDPGVLDDPLLGEYVGALFSSLVAAARQQGAMDATQDRAFAWETFLVRDKAVNAFALPGGYVGVYLGLIALTATPDELASVLAHELTHVTQRHIARGMVSAKQRNWAALAGMILAAVAASRANSGDALQAVVLGGQAAIAQGQLNFSRDMEREADRLGLELMAEAGFGRAGMAAMFAKLDAATHLNDNSLYPYLRSHPLTVERIAEARLRAGGALNAAPEASARRVEHALMQARAKVLMDRGEPALRRLAGQWPASASATLPLTDDARLAQIYAAALALVLLRDFGPAADAIDAADALARQRFASEPRAARACALLRLEALDAQAEALPPAALSAALERTLAPWVDDSSRVMALARAQAALVRLRAHEAQASVALRGCMQEMQTWLADHPHDALAWQTLAQCTEPLGLALRAVRAQAEAAAARGDLTGAIDRLSAAQSMARKAGAGEYVEASVIESRLRAVQAERRELLDQESPAQGRP